MGKRVLPQLDRSRLPYRADRPSALAIINLARDVGSEDPAVVARVILELFVEEAEAVRLAPDFARHWLASVTPELPALVQANRITDWLEAWWLAGQDQAHGIPRPERWQKGKSL